LTSEQHLLFIDLQATAFVHCPPGNSFCALTSEQRLLLIDLRATYVCSSTSDQIVVFIDLRPTIFVHRLPTNIVRPLTIILPSRLQCLVFFICNFFANIYTYQHLVVIDNIAVVSFTSNERNHVF
jgi:hypothetical protein